MLCIRTRKVRARKILVLEDTQVIVLFCEGGHKDGKRIYKAKVEMGLELSLIFLHVLFFSFFFVTMCILYKCYVPLIIWA